MPDLLTSPAPSPVMEREVTAPRAVPAPTLHANEEAALFYSSERCPYCACYHGRLACA